MPLTKKGSEIKKIFQKEYGKKKGIRIFYSWENKNKDINKLRKLIK